MLLNVSNRLAPIALDFVSIVIIIYMRVVTDARNFMSARYF